MNITVTEQQREERLTKKHMKHGNILYVMEDSYIEKRGMQDEYTHSRL